MFTSRVPRNRAEIAECVSFFSHSPHGTINDLTDAQMVDIWEDLLKSGLAIIEIVEHRELVRHLKIPSKAKANPHFLHGFVSVSFTVYVKFDVVQDLVARSNDDCDPLVYFCQLFHAYKSGASPRCPIVNVDEEGRLLDSSISTLTTPVYHSDITQQLSLRTLRYLQYIDAYAERQFRSCHQDALGFSHDVALLSTLGKQFIVPFQKAGLSMIREFSGNHHRRNSQKQYLFGVVKDSNTACRLAAETPSLNLSVDFFSRYTFLFPRRSDRHNVGLSQKQQMVCYLLIVGYSYRQIARAFDPVYFDQMQKELDTLLEKQIRNSLDESEVRRAKQLQKSIDNLIGNAKGHKREAAEKLEIAGLLSRPFDEDRLIAALLQNNIVAKEIRDYFFPLYPWPEDLDSRRA